MSRFLNPLSLLVASVGMMGFMALSATPAAACRCQTLNVTPVDRTTFTFTSGLDTLGGGKIVKVVYDFGDGTKAENADPAQAVTHQYTKEGKFTARVTIFLKLAGKVQELTGKVCTKPIEVKPAPSVPHFECTALEVTKITRTKYDFKLTGNAGGGATIDSANFDFGDKAIATKVQPDASGSFVTEHDYQTTGNVTVVAALLVSINGNMQVVTSDKCTANVTVQSEEACVPLPEVEATAQGRKACPPPATLASTPTPTPTPPATPAATVPAELPATGPTEIVGSVMGLGGLTAAGVSYARARRTLHNSFRR